MGANTTNADNRIYCELCQLIKNKAEWNKKIPYVASLLENSAPKIVAKSMWLLGEMGLLNPQAIAVYTANIAQFIASENDLLRERAANALGRIGRADYKLVSPYMGSLLSLSDDKSSNVRLSFIWASENIATNTPTAYANDLPIFEKLLDDDNERVRMEAPEIFRVIGKRKPELAMSYLAKLEYVATHDTNKVVRIHAQGAIKAIASSLSQYCLSHYASL